MNFDDKTVQRLSEAPASRQSWEPMRLTYLGHVGEVVQGGGGKLSPTPGDPGDIRKPPGHG
jgi:hypothetical protein